MARLARAVVPGVPHHVTQRGNRRQQVFFSAEDYAYYQVALAAQCRSEGVETLAYCLMPNHVHLILTPPDEGALSAVLSRLHRDYARRINFREQWRGYLWQGRYASFAMDEDYLLACARYVELNPVRARLGPSGRVVLVERGSAFDGRRRSPRAAWTLDGAGGRLGRAFGRGCARRKRGDPPGASTGRPLGSQEFVARLEQTLGRTLGRCKPGRKPKDARPDQVELF